VICEIMNEDGTMSRLDDLVTFAQFHNLKIGTIRDLIAYRRRHDHLVEKRAEMAFHSKWGGDWKAMTFYNKATGDEQVALVKGRIDPDKPTLVRMHTLSMFVDAFGEESERAGLLSRSMELIAEEGSGVIVVINRQMKDSVSRFIKLRAEGKGAGAPEVEELRDYGVGAQILAELGVQDMTLLTNTHHTLVGLEGYGLSIVGERAIPGTGGE
ncbi:MAG: ribB, partial [Sphingomonas bacterium]|nr:ribB [Sphingomonas bacterium]